MMERNDEMVPAGQLEQRAARRRQLRKWAPLIAPLPVALLAIAVFQGARIAQLEVVGLRTSGEVVSLNKKWRSGKGAGYSYYPVVHFHVSGNSTVEFEDRVGSNPPPHRPGERVPVLYLAEDPAGHAMIDGGIRNWAIPALFLAGAILLVRSLIGMLPIPSQKPPPPESGGSGSTIRH